jgi:transposase
MRYELADYEWIAIRPMLPNKPRGVPRVSDRRVLNGIFWILRSGAPWRDLPAARNRREGGLARFEANAALGDASMHSAACESCIIDPGITAAKR